MRLSDTALGLIVLAAGLALGWYAFGLPTIPGQNYGAATFPLLIAAGLLACGAALVLRGVKTPAPAGGAPADPPIWIRNPRGVLGVLATAGLVVFYIYVSKPLGFIPTAIIVTFAMFMILKVAPLKAAVLSVVAAFVVDFMFRSMLLVPLPFGIMPRLPW